MIAGAPLLLPFPVMRWDARGHRLPLLINTRDCFSLFPFSLLPERVSQKETSESRGVLSTASETHARVSDKNRYFPPILTFRGSDVQQTDKGRREGGSGRKRDRGDAVYRTALRISLQTRKVAVAYRALNGTES